MNIEHIIRQDLQSIECLSLRNTLFDCYIHVDSYRLVTKWDMLSDLLHSHWWITSGICCIFSDGLLTKCIMMSVSMWYEIWLTVWYVAQCTACGMLSDVQIVVCCLMYRLWYVVWCTEWYAVWCTECGTLPSVQSISCSLMYR